VREECPLGEGVAEPAVALKKAKDGLLLPPSSPRERDRAAAFLGTRARGRKAARQVGERREITGQRISKREKWAHEDLFKCVPPRTGSAALLDNRKLY